MTTSSYLSFRIGAIWSTLQCRGQSPLPVATSQHLPYLADSALYLFCGDGLNGGSEGIEIEVGGRVRVESVDVDCPIVDGCHCVEDWEGWRKEGRSEMRNAVFVGVFAPGIKSDWVGYGWWKLASRSPATEEVNMSGNTRDSQ